MKFSERHYAIALYEALASAKAGEQENILNNFAQLLKDNGHLSFWPEIESEFLTYSNRKDNISEVYLTFAREGHSETAILEKLKNILGRNFQVKKNTDKSLIGGVLVETADKRIDLSLKRQFKRLNDLLSK